MNPERWVQIEELFHRATECDAEQRAAFLDEACRGDVELRRQVEALLACEASAEDHVRAAVRSELSGFGFSLVGQTVSHYRILNGLGGGGMGMVYKAEDLKLGRCVALKFLPEELASDATALRRFEQEARAASALNHPNICTIYGVGEYAMQPFLVMELLQGQTLRELIPVEEGVRSVVKTPPLPLKRLLDIAIQIADGLEAAHTKGIIHRDIKPANIFATTQGRVKILDFGLAKLQECETAELQSPSTGPKDSKPGWNPNVALTRTGTTIGTAGYMSPEQLRDEKLDARTDLFSFGLVLYEGATGKRAFAAETASLVREAILNHVPTPVRKLNTAIPPRLEQIINKALEKDREARYQNAAEMRADLAKLRDRRQLGWSATRLRVLMPVLCALVLAIGVTLWRTRQRSASPIELQHRQLTINSSENAIVSGAISPGVGLTAKFVPDWSFGLLQRTDQHILIWKVGSPFRGDIPDATVPVDLQEAAQKLGLQIEMETYAAKGFALKFANAMKRKAEPDVLAFDNYAILDGIPPSIMRKLGLLSLGSFEGIPASARKSLITVSESLYSLEKEQGGWEFLIATSRNFDKARDLVLNKISCEESSADLVKDEALLREITGPTLMATFAGAFGGNTAIAIHSLLGQDSDPRDSPKVNDIRICGVWGNRRLAFVNTAILFQSATALGQRSSLVVLTRPESSWELKVMSRDCAGDRRCRDFRIINKLSEQLPKLANNSDGAHLQPPSLRYPPDQARLPRCVTPTCLLPERPALEWDNSGSQTIGYLIESQFESNSSIQKPTGDWSDSAFELVLQRPARTIRVGAPFGVGMQPHRWRIWAIDRNGGTAISVWRTINYTN